MTESAVVQHVASLEDMVRADQNSYKQVYGDVYNKALEALKAQGLITMKPGELGYDMSALEDNQTAIDLAATAGKAEAYRWMKHMYSDFDTWDDIRKEEEMIGKLGFSSDQLASSIKAHGKAFSTDAMLKDYENPLKTIFNRKNMAYLGKIRAGDSEDIFENVFGWKRSEPKWNHVDWNSFRDDDENIRNAVFNYAMGNKINTKYLKQAKLYNA